MKLLSRCAGSTIAARGTGAERARATAARNTASVCGSQATVVGQKPVTPYRGRWAATIDDRVGPIEDVGPGHTVDMHVDEPRHDQVASKHAHFGSRRLHWPRLDADDTCAFDQERPAGDHAVGQDEIRRRRGRSCGEAREASRADRRRVDAERREHDAQALGLSGAEPALALHPDGLEQQVAGGRRSCRRARSLRDREWRRGSTPPCRGTSPCRG